MNALSIILDANMYAMRNGFEDGSWFLCSEILYVVTCNASNGMTVDANMPASM